MVMVFYQFDPIWVSLHTRSGQQLGKKDQILTFLILKNKDMFLMQNVPRNLMVSIIFIYVGYNSHKLGFIEWRHH